MPNETLTPEQIKQLQTYGNVLLGDNRRALNAGGALAGVLRSMAGHAHIQRAEQFRARQRGQRGLDRVAPPQSNFSTSSVEPATSTTRSTASSDNSFGNTSIKTADGIELAEVKTPKGHRASVAKQYASRFQGLLDDLHAAGYDIQRIGGYNNRNIRGTNVRSRHADAEAMDINPQRNRVGSRGDIPEALARELSKKHGFKWGGTFKGFRRDPMHFEIDKNWKPPAQATENTTQNTTQQISRAPASGINRRSVDLLPVTAGVAQIPGAPPEDLNADAPGPTVPPGAEFNPDPNAVYTTGGGSLDRRMNLGGPTAEETASAEATEQPPQNVNVAQASTQGRLPAGVPPRIAPNSNIQMLEQELSNAQRLDPDELNDIIKQHQQLVGPQAVETAAGTAYYNGRTGEFLYMVPKLHTAPLGVGRITTQEQYFLGPQGRVNVPVAPGSGGSNQNNASPQNPPVSPQFGAFPRSGDISDLYQYDSRASALSKIAEERAGTQAKVVNEAVERGLSATTNMRTLSAIETSTRAAGKSAWRGPIVGDWAQRAAQWLTNFGHGSYDVLLNLPHTELFQKLISQLASEATQDLTARGTNFQLDTFMRNLPGLSQSYEGAVMLTDYLKQVSRHHVELGKLAQKLPPERQHEWNEIEAEYNRKHPIVLNVPPVGDRPARKFYTGVIESPEQVRRDVPKGMWFIDPNGKPRYNR